MTGDGFHVHGPHDHALDTAAERAEHDRLANRVAVTTAVLATLAAIFSHIAGTTLASAGLNKNEAAIRKTEAANQWAYYQGKSTRETLVEMGQATAPPELRADLALQAARYRSEMAEIEGRARALEAASLVSDRLAGEQMHTHHRWAQATTALQVAIAVAAIAWITRRRWLQGLVYVFAAVGLGLAGMALAHL